VFQAGLCGGGDRAAKKLNVLQMSHHYDRDGVFCKLWCPELALLPASKIHMPWMLTKQDQAAFKLSIVPYAEISASDLRGQPDHEISASDLRGQPSRHCTYPRPVLEITGGGNREL